MSKGFDIKRLIVRVYSRRCRGAFRNPHHQWDQKNAVLVFVETYGGALGVGEAWCDSGGVSSVKAIIEEDLAPLVVGQPVSKPEALHRRMLRLEVMNVKGGALYAAASAVDIAVWDAFARMVQLPLYNLLGGARDAVPVYGSAGLYAQGYGADHLARDMQDAVAKGFCGVKIKVAGAPLRQDVDRVRAVREAIGPEPRLMIDGMFAPSVPEAIRLGRSVADQDIWFYEAPTDRRDLDGWSHIRRTIGIPLSGPEVESGVGPFRAALERQAVDYLQADATICGGMTELRRISALATAFHRPLTLHSSGSVFAFAANAHAAAGLQSGESIEHHLLHTSGFGSLQDSGWRIANGLLHLPANPGLGLEIDPDNLARLEAA